MNVDYIHKISEGHISLCAFFIYCANVVALNKNELNFNHRFNQKISLRRIIIIIHRIHIYRLV